MSTQGPFSPATAANDASIGTVAWSNPDNVKVSDNIYATQDFTGSASGNYVKTTDYGFSIPTGATINSITVEAEAKDSIINQILFVRIVRSGVIETTVTNNQVISTTEAYYTFNALPLWNKTWTADIINASDFGAVIYSNSGGSAHTMSVDHVRITVDYTEVPLTISVNDSVTVSESVTTNIVSLVPSVNDTITLTDVPTFQITIVLSVSDSITVTETFDRNPRDVSVFDTITVTESFDESSRYWVGGTGNWDASTTTNWSFTSGGVGGASVPTSSNRVIFDTASNATAYTCTITATASCLDLTMGAPASGQITWAGSSDMLVYGNFNLSGGTSGINRTYSGSISLMANSSGKTVTTNGVNVTTGTFKFGVFAGGTNGTWTLQDGLRATSITLNDGTLVLNGQAIICNSFASEAFNARTLTMGSGTITCSANSDAFTIDTNGGSGTTVTAGTSTVTLTGSNTFFKGGGKTYYNFVCTGTTTQIFGSNTFNDITVSAGKTLKFTAGTTTTVANFSTSGTAGNLITIDSDTTGTHTLTKSGGGLITSEYLNIQHSIATPVDTWYASTNSVNNQGVVTAGSGWTFTAGPPKTLSVSDTITVTESVSNPQIPAPVSDIETVSITENLAWNLSFKDPGNIYASDNTYTSFAATSGDLYVEVSKDAGATFSIPITVTFTGSDTLQTCGTGSTELWGFSWTRADMVNASFRVRLSQGNYSQIYKTFGFTTGSDILTGVEVAIEGNYTGGTMSLDLLKVKVYYGTSVLPVQAGSQVYASDGRKNGEGAGTGTGVLVFYDSTGTWIAVDSGVAVDD